MRRLLRTAAVVVIGLAAGAGLLYQFFGLRVVLGGGGTPTLQFVQSADEQAERIRLHREAQRAALVPASLDREVTGAPTADAATPAATPPAATPGEVLATSPGTTAATGAIAANAIAPSAGPAPYWTDFRGPKRDGEYRERPLVMNWPAAGLKPMWKQPAGAGYASFVSAGGRAFTIEQRGPEEVVAAYDVATGRELWTNAWAADFRESMGGDGPRATPTWADGRVYALGATGELRALDATTGRVVWRTNILQDSGAANLQWGMAAAPLVVDDMVIVLPGGSRGQSVVAYDRATGRRAWGALDDQQSYASPMLATLNGVRQLLIVSASRVAGLSLNGGAVLWEYSWPGPNGINAAQPLVIGSNRIFISSGYGAGAAVIELTAGATGTAVREVWRNTRMKNRFASSVLHDGIIYGLDESILAAVDAGTGELKWKGGRYGYGQLLLAAGHLIVLTEDGDLALVRATPARHEEITRFHVLDGKTWNPPAIAGGYLLVRNLAEMAAFDLRIGR